MINLIQTEAELEELLSTPSPEDVEFFRKLEGDIVIVGVGGKIGPSLALRAGRSARAAGAKIRIIGTDVHCEDLDADLLEAAGVEILCVDLLDPSDFATLPDAPNVIFMAGRKFGSTGQESLTWAMNVYVPALIAERYRYSRIVAFSSGNIYPFLPVMTGGATEETVPAPIGEYAQSVLGRERMFEYFSARHGTPVTLLRLNYAIDLRYGVLVDIGHQGFRGPKCGCGRGRRQRDLAGRRQFCRATMPCPLPVSALHLEPDRAGDDLDSSRGQAVRRDLRQRADSGRTGSANRPAE